MLDEQVAIKTTRVFAQLCLVHQLHLFLDGQALLAVTRALIAFRLDDCKCAPHEDALEEYPEASASTERSSAGSYVCS